MDKRTILLVISLSLTLFIVNMFFSMQERERHKAWYDRQREIRGRQQEQLTEDVSRRTAKLEDLPALALFSDANATYPVGVGAVVDGVLLASFDAKIAPTRVYAGKRWFDIVPGTSEGDGVVLYHIGTNQNLRIGELSSVGSFDLQMISIHPEERSIHVSLAEFRDGSFKFLLDRPEANALVLMKMDDDFLPVGIYRQDRQAFIPLEQVSALAQNLIKPAKVEAMASPALEERFYVLENEYQQLVFSSRGGALVEMNLPFRSMENDQSIVREINFDKEMVEKHPENAHFPLNPYFTPGDRPQGPFEEHDKGSLGGYYPLLRRDLIDSTTGQRHFVSPQYYALNIVSEYPELARMNYRVVAFERDRIVFEAVQAHRRITKTFTLEQDGRGAPYCLNLEIQIDGDNRGLWLTSGIPEVELMSGGASSPLMKYRMTRNDKVELEKIKLPKDAITVSSIYPDWLCNSNGFFGLVLDPLSDIDAGYRAQKVAGEVVPSRFIEIDKEHNTYKAQKFPGYAMYLPLGTRGGGGTMKFRIFAGPFAEEVLTKVDARFADPLTGYNPGYISCITFHGWFSFISEPFARFLFILMKLFHRMTQSWAVAIILLTVVLRLMLYPLNAWSMKSMRRMQQIAPEVTAIQEKHKKDPKKAQMEIMNLYRSRGVNPMLGCFPMLVQMPFLIGMFDLLRSTFELRGVSFIPGWIDNLTAPDVLFAWETPILFIGKELHLLPILLGGVMFLQQRLMSTLPKDKTKLTDQQKQQKSMGTIMTAVFTVMFYHFASGLNIYWLSSMLLGIGQQWLINYQLGKGKNKPEIESPPPTTKKKRARAV